LRIARLEPLHVAAAGDLFASEYPQRASEVTRWSDDASAQRWVVTDDSGTVLAFAALWRYRGARLRVDLVVRPESRRSGVGSALLEQVVSEARAIRALTVQARAPESAIDALHFLERRGFRETMRMYAQELRVADAVVPATRDELPVGLTRTTLEAEMARGADWFAKLHECFAVAREGWPDPDPQPDETVSASEFRRLLDAFPLDPSAFLILVRDERYVGFTGSFGTAVVPAERGRGLATLLKCDLVRLMRERGVETMRTSSGNATMMRINERLGYRTLAAEVRLVRRLQR
jgi:GNAT superfamily N-acetyltransferase